MGWYRPPERGDFVKIDLSVLGHGMSIGIMEEDGVIRLMSAREWEILMRNKRCPRCGGSGEVRTRYLHRLVVCRTCSGLGHVLPKTIEPEGSRNLA
jgi:DnaJ-class molecular chaperone